MFPLKRRSSNQFFWFKISRIFFLGVVHLSCVKLLYDIFIWSINLSSLLQTVSVNAFVFCFKIFFTQFCLRRRQILLLIHSVFGPKVYFFPYSSNLFIQIANDRILMFLNVIKRQLQQYYFLHCIDFFVLSSSPLILVAPSSFYLFIKYSLLQNNRKRLIFDERKLSKGFHSIYLKHCSLW